MNVSLRERADLLTVLLAREITDDSVVVMGTGTPVTAVAVLLALHTHAPRTTYTSPLAGALSVLPHRLSLGHLERAAYDNAVLRGAQIIDLWEMATINPKVADRWLQFFRPAQTDRWGNMNNSLIGGRAAPRRRLPGSVGIGDMAAFYPRLYAYVTRHNRAAFPARVDFVSAPGTLGSAAERRRRGLRWGRPFRVYSDLCVFEFDDQGCARVHSVHPGVELREIEEATGFPVDASAAVQTVAVRPPELEALAHVDPNGLRLLEFLPARERRELVVQTLARERDHTT